MSGAGFFEGAGQRLAGRIVREGKGPEGGEESESSERMCVNSEKGVLYTIL